MTEHWRGCVAQEVTAGRLRALMVPSLGGKIVSLRYDDRVELLANEHLTAQPPEPGATFATEPLGGWDECVPTIDACRGPVGLPFPDHGEAWRRPWDDRGDGWFGYSGAAAPYDFARRLAPDGPRLRLHYRVRSRHDRPLGILWAAHPQFAAPPGTRVQLGDATEMLDVLVDPAAPRTCGPEGLSIGDVPPPGPGRPGYRKCYVGPDQHLDRATVVRPDGVRITMSWDAEATPYLGIWLDRAALAREPVVAVEPTNGFYDSAERAATNGRLAGVEAGGSLAWHVDLEVEG
jgi:galactose mutarotase-like enzyme